MCFSLTDVCRKMDGVCVCVWGNGAFQKGSVSAPWPDLLNAPQFLLGRMLESGELLYRVKAALHYLGGYLQLRISCFPKCSKEGKTKTLYNLLKSLRSLTLRLMNKSKARLWIPCHIVVHEIKRAVWQGETWLWKAPIQLLKNTRKDLIYAKCVY